MNPNITFRLRVPVSEGTILITCFDDQSSFHPSHFRLYIEVRFAGKVIFPRGVLYCGLPNRYATDSKHAKELVLAAVAMKPGDTDREYFADYSEEQIAFAERYGEELDLQRQMRYCDPETGEVKE